ncbi:acetyl esterase/lipase [Sphingobium sp. B11D3B]|nr:acetyl esterase/lipase [Sphingobium sp. B11D3B]
MIRSHLPRVTLIAAIAATVGVTSLPADASLRDRIRERMAGRMQQDIAADKTVDGREMAYGRDPAQTLAFWPAVGQRSAPVPLVLFVHGGGWQHGNKTNATGQRKVAHLTAQGYALASIDYRLVPQATVEQQAADAASALAYVIAHADKLNIDPRRIVLMGHSAGAHLVALVGTDPRYLREAGLAPDAAAGIVALDGAAYDVPAQMKSGPRIMGKTYTEAFGNDPARQKALSPTLHAAAPNAPAFLIFHVDREDGTAQARALAEALRKAGTPVQIDRFEGKGLQGHMEINRRLGDPDYPATPVLDKWLKALFSR